MQASPFYPQVLKAEELMQAGHYEMALQIFELVLRHDPENVGVINDAALAKAEIGEPLKAAQLFEHALGIDPAHEPTFYNLLDLLVAQEAGDLATEAFVVYGAAIPETEEKARYRKGLERLQVEAAREAETADVA